MDLFSKNEEKYGPVQQNERKRWTCSAKMKKKMDLFSKMNEKGGLVQQKLTRKIKKATFIIRKDKILIKLTYP